MHASSNTGSIKEGRVLTELVRARPSRSHGCSTTTTAAVVPEGGRATAPASPCGVLGYVLHAAGRKIESVIASFV